MIALEGSFTIGGNAFDDLCVCAFAQAGRGVVMLSASAPVFDVTTRTTVVQAAIDRLRSTLAAG